MKKFSKIGIILGAVVANINSQATVSMSCTDPGTYSMTGITATLNGGPSIAGDDYIGLYGFTVASGGSPNVSSPLYSICFSPLGNLDVNDYHTYTSETFATASPGLNPGDWANPNHTSVMGAQAGIQNAAYLFSTLESGVLSSSDKQTQGAALALAIYTALYNSTSYGHAVSALTSSVFRTSLTGNLLIDYNADLNKLNTSGFNGTTLFDGNFLVPTPATAPGAGNSGQEFILLTGVTDKFSPVPESSTVIAGLLLLLPFGAGIARVFRKKVV